MKIGFSIIVLAAAFLGFAQQPATGKERLLDCPLRDAPFSASSPLIDILLNPAAKAIVEREFAISFAGAPPQFVGTQAPSFASILTLHEAAGFFHAKPGAVERSDEALRRLPVTDLDRAARCARYDDDRPAFALPAGKSRVLLFEKMTGFRDGPSVDAAHAMFLDLALKNGWTIVSSDKGGAISPTILRHFDAVIWNNVSGDVLTVRQRKALRDYVEGGGGFVAVHGSAGDPVWFWDWYADRLIGARFSGHPIAKQFQDARIVVKDPTGPIARGLPAEWTMKDEWYSFKTNPRAVGATIVATLDESTYTPEGMFGQDLRMGDHPIAWSNCVGRGKMFYSAIGHLPETYSQPQVRVMLANAVTWAMAPGACRRK